MHKLTKIGSSASLLVAGAVIASVFNAASLPALAQTATATPAKAAATPAAGQEQRQLTA